MIIVFGVTVMRKLVEDGSELDEWPIDPSMLDDCPSDLQPLVKFIEQILDDVSTVGIRLDCGNVRHDYGGSTRDAL